MQQYSTAAVLTAKEKVEIMKFPIPEIGEREGLMKIESCGVCGFDSEAYRYGGNGMYQLPNVLGHEIIGRVEALGDEAARIWGLKPGDRIAVEEYIPCRQCDNCLTGNYRQCFETRYGAMSIHDPRTALYGGFSEYMYLHPHSIIHKIDSEASAELLQLFIPISNGIDWVHVGRVQVGDTVVIQGPGPMGLASVVAAKEAGAGNIIITGLSKDERRLEIARELGADHTFYADTQDLVKEIKEVTNGKLANAVINASTSPQQLATAVELAGERATVVHSGSDHRPTQDMIATNITYKLLTIKGVLGRPKKAVGAALKLIESGKYPLDKMISHAFSVDEAARAMDIHAFGKDGCIHVAIVNE
ncbi:alcohol dehydrogenase catalytic domain-containing protein [Paenibacillus sp. IB182496]|uniref:Alcohol dehydrogenase catalytic domain-containing protein n=1 Tax=Paenibacillus sabuli TaxID=2772509 RepID=A0A927BQE9_9BACL|nr:alcohol dehydrogenase catalytic domain-containing protein [Paenibacillus sabuli]MBD2843790.1 alcohol dehydrogenase catalytic domain-containing protein [Paenibacillus sabuli]